MPALSPDAPVGTPTDLAWLRRGWWVVVLCLVLGAIGGLLLALVSPKVYESKTSVLVLPTVAADGSTIVRNADVNMDNEIQIVRSQPVALAAQALLRTATPPDELVKNVTVTVPPNTFILQIAGKADTAAGAVALSHSFAEGYLASRGDQVQAEVDAQKADIDKKLEDLNKRLDATADLKLSDGAPDTVGASTQRQILVPQITQLSQRKASLDGAAIDPGTVINDARLPTSPTSPVPVLYVASGAAVGLVIGLCIAYAVGGRRRRVRSASDVGGGGEHGVAFEVPGPIAEVGVLTAGRGAEIFDRLRLALTTAVPAERPAVLVCPATSSAGASLVTMNLASSLSRSGHRVLILCADPRSVTPGVLGVDEASGLADCLRESLELADRVQISTFSARVAVVAPGRDLVGALAATSSERLALLLLKLRQDTSLVRAGDFVLVEAPDTSQGVDAQELARVVDCCVIVSETGRVAIRDVERTEHDLAAVGGTVAVHMVVPPLPAPTVPTNPLDDRLGTSSRPGTTVTGRTGAQGSGQPTERARS